MTKRNHQTETERQADFPRYVASWNDHSRMVGRLAVIAALVVFFTLYGLGLIFYGPLIAIGLGWIPSAAIAWGIANLIMILARPTRQKFARPY